MLKLGEKICSANSQISKEANSFIKFIKIQRTQNAQSIYVQLRQRLPSICVFPEKITLIAGIKQIAWCGYGRRRAFLHSETKVNAQIAI